jgi:hypothetical protein
MSSIQYITVRRDSLTSLFFNSPSKSILSPPMMMFRTSSTFNVSPDKLSPFTISPLKVDNTVVMSHTQEFVDFVNSQPAPGDFMSLFPVGTFNSPSTTTPSVQYNTPPMAEPVHANSKVARKLNLDDSSISLSSDSNVCEGRCHRCQGVKDVVTCSNLNPPMSYQKSKCMLKYCIPCISKIVTKNCHIRGLPCIDALGGWNNYEISSFSSSWCCPKCMGFCPCNKCLDVATKLSTSTVLDTKGMPRVKRSRKQPGEFYVVDPVSYSESALLSMVGASKPIETGVMESRSPVNKKSKSRLVYEHENRSKKIELRVQDPVTGQINWVDLSPKKKSRGSRQKESSKELLPSKYKVSTNAPGTRTAPTSGVEDHVIEHDEVCIADDAGAKGCYNEHGFCDQYKSCKCQEPVYSKKNTNCQHCGLDIDHYSLD